MPGVQGREPIHGSGHTPDEESHEMESEEESEEPDNGNE